MPVRRDFQNEVQGRPVEDDRMDLSQREKFSGNRCNDVIFAIAFLLNLVAVGAWIGHCAGEGKFGEIFDSDTTTRAPTRADMSMEHQQHAMQYLALLVCTGVGFALVWAGLWMGFLQTCPVGIVWTSLLFFPTVSCIMGVLLLHTGAPGLLLLLGGLVGFAYVWCVQDRIPFTAKLFAAVSSVYKNTSSIFAVALAILLLSAAAQVAYMFAFIPMYEKQQERRTTTTLAPDEEKQGDPMAGAFIVLLFSYFWTLQVLVYTLHVACCGVIARWYFNKDVENSVGNSTKAACTSYFGSICFGSFLMAIVKTLKYLCDRALRDAQERRDCNPIVVMVLQCVLRCIEQMAKFFTTFAFVMVAIYGIPFCDAGKAAYGLMQRGFIETLVQYQLAGAVSSFGSLAGALIVAGLNALVALYLHLTMPFVAVAAAVGFLAGFFTMSLVSSVVESGVDCLFVCFSEEPLNLKSARPELYDAFQERTNFY